MSATRRSLILALFACAMLVRALVPAGWMPTVGANGGIVISMCTGMGAVEMVLAPDGTLHEKAPAKHDGTTDHPCTFAGLGQAFAAADPIPMPVLPPATFTAPPLTPHLVSIGRGLAAPPPPQTGPPILV
ncbi:MAG: hypothetical protein V4564_20205 [Pseudomonadota bacterium]